MTLGGIRVVLRGHGAATSQENWWKFETQKLKSQFIRSFKTNPRSTVFSKKSMNSFEI